MTSGSYFFLSFQDIFDGVNQPQNTIKTNSDILGSVTTPLTSNTFLSPTDIGSFLVEKSNGETLQAIEIRDGHSIALRNMTQWFLTRTANVGSAQQKDLVMDFFPSNNATYAQSMFYVSGATGGSYQCVNYGSVFSVLIEAGSLDPAQYAINGCICEPYAVGSWTVFGPVSPNLGSSRARVMRTLFYGTTGDDPRVGSNYITGITGIKVFNNDFNDVGKRAYYNRVAHADSVNGTISESSNITGSIEGNSGSIWYWSFCVGSGHSNGVATSYAYSPEGTLVNTASNNPTGVDEIGLHSPPSGDVWLSGNNSFGSVQGAVNLNFFSVILVSATATSHSVYLTRGSAIVGSVLAGGIAQSATAKNTDFKVHHNVPVFGSFTLGSNNFDVKDCWVLTKRTTGLSGSIDTVLFKFIGSTNSTSTIYTHAGMNGFANNTIVNGLLGSVGPNTGSLALKYQVYRTGSTVVDYINGYGVYYG